MSLVMDDGYTANLPPELAAVLPDIVAALAEAQAKHGAQLDLPMGTGPDVRPLGYLLTRTLATAPAIEALTRDECERAAARGELTWRHILTEEWAESLAAVGDELDAELCQVIAVCVRMIAARRHQEAS